MSDYKFVPTDAAEIINEMISAYETETGHTLNSADPDRLFLAWAASIIVQERVNQNYIGNQNIPSRARGENLDAIGIWIFNLYRREALPAHSTERFSIGTVRSAPVIIPLRTRVTDASQTLVWETSEEGVIAAGDTYVDVPIRCQTAGTAGNGFSAGAIETLIDVDNVPYDVSVENTTESAGGSQTETDEEYFERLRASLDAYSSAGSRGAYIYHAKAVSAQIADVQVTRPRFTRSETVDVWEQSGDKCAFLGGDGLIPSSLVVKAHGSSTAATVDTDYTVSYESGLLEIVIVSGGGLDEATALDLEIKSDDAGCVDIYALMDDGTVAGAEIKADILAACSDDKVRPLTDKVSVKDASYYSVTVSVEYWTSKQDGRSLSEISKAVKAAVDEYAAWQCAKIGRDVNPSKLYALLMETGVKRVNIVSPAFHTLSDGSDFNTPEVAHLSGTPTITYEGAEDE